MTDAAPHTRRAVLGTGLSFIGLAAAAACSSSTAGTDSADGAGSATDTDSDTTSGPGGTIVDLSAIPVGKAVAAKINGKDAVVARPTADTVSAHTAICTHQGCTVDVDGAKLVCPCHGSEFNALTGAVTHGPATKDLASIDVRVSDGKVVEG